MSSAPQAQDMYRTEAAAAEAAIKPARPRPVSRRRARRSRVFGGGPAGNEQLTATLGAILILLFGVLGITILLIGRLLPDHMFVGLLLLGPIGVKLASTGFRFMRYYAHSAEYRRKGPPNPLMRGIAPFVVLTTVAVFASGVVLMFEGPAHRAGWAEIHKASFILWIGFTGLHVLGHVLELPDVAACDEVDADPRLPALNGRERRRRPLDRPCGRSRRWARTRDRAGSAVLRLDRLLRPLMLSPPSSERGETSCPRSRCGSPRRGNRARAADESLADRWRDRRHGVRGGRRGPQLPRTLHLDGRHSRGSRRFRPGPPRPPRRVRTRFPELAVNARRQRRARCRPPAQAPAAPAAAGACRGRVRRIVRCPRTRH